jgi:hypothetical protein
VSRAYYAAFFHCLDFARREFAFVPAGLGRDHRLLRSAMRTARPELADRLDNLRRERNQADYDIAEPWPQATAAAACDVAAEILGDL